MKWWKILWGGVLLVSVQTVYGQSSGTGAAAEEAAYTRVITGRSQKIVDKLDIPDTVKARAVRDVLVIQYRRLNGVHDWREAQQQMVKSAKLSAEAKASALKRVDTIAMMKLMQYHRNFVGKLGAVLTPEQVGKVKDAMTYNVLEVTYRAYTDMLPQLTAAQKDTILGDLVEAREYAMDGGSSEEKHWWFGKYKGRINNFLSREGINLDEARKAWAARRAHEDARQGTSGK